MMTEQRNYGNGGSANGMEMGNSSQELVSKGRHHNWRNLAAFVVIGIVVLVLIILGVVFLAGGSNSDKRAEAITSQDPLYGSSISLDDVVEGKFSPKGFNGTWISGSANRPHAEALTSSTSWLGTCVPLEEMMKGMYNPKLFNGSWFSDTEFFYRNEQGDALLFDITTRSSEIIVTAEFLFHIMLYERDVVAGTYNFAQNPHHLQDAM